MARSNFPTCRHCSSELIAKSYYLMFGACAEEGKYVEEDWEVFMNMGRHSRALPEDLDVEIVCVQHSVQVDIAFCSTKCMREFFAAIIDRLEDS